MKKTDVHCLKTTPLWIAARIILSQRGSELFNCWRSALKTREAEDIHDLRVASRRLREGLALFGACYPARLMETIDKRIKKLTRLLGEMRNTDEAILFFTALAEEVSGPACRDELQTFIGGTEDKRQRETRRMVNGLRKLDRKGLYFRYHQAINELSLFSLPGQGVDPLGALSGFAAEAFDSRFAAIAELLVPARDPNAIEAQHCLRIAIKHYRYRMELLSFLFGDCYEQLHVMVKSYQDVLGTMNDLDVFGRMAQDGGFSPDVERELLEGIAARRLERFRALNALMESSPLETVAVKVKECCDV